MLHQIVTYFPKFSKMVNCINKSAGCLWSGEMKELIQHLLSCEEEFILCPKECGKKIQKSNVEDHIELQCDNTTRKCEHCGKDIPGGKLKDHNTECIKFQVQCPFLCSSKLIPRETLDTHLREECPLNMEQCVFSVTGCHYNGPVYKHISHVKNHGQEHLMLACGVIAELKQEITDLKAWNVQLKQDIRDSNAIFWKISSFSFKFKDGNDECFGGDEYYLKPWHYNAKFSLSQSVSKPSFYGFNIQIASGLFDDALEWPFNKQIKVTFKDQKLEGNSYMFAFVPPEPEDAPVELHRPEDASFNDTYCFQNIDQKHIEACLHNDSLLIRIEIVN